MRIQSLPTTQIRFEGSKNTTPAPVTFGSLKAWNNYGGTTFWDDIKNLGNFFKNTFKKKPPNKELPEIETGRAPA